MTAELAVALPAVVLVLLAVLAVAAAGTARVHTADAARAAARVAALGEGHDEIRRVARAVAGADVEVSIGHDPPWVTVTVRRQVAAHWLSVVPWSVAATATAWVEP
ncbi:MAG: TadE family type IV pilus minor pilin [Cellulomonadaceae bacterium]